LLDPHIGVKRGIIDSIETGKGTTDSDDRMIPITIGEIREIYNVLQLLKEERG
jgi:hypothetical protein